jgi:hypothetical protein
LRTPDGKITTFGLPGATSFGPEAINPAGATTGVFFFSTGGAHGFLRTFDGAITQFDAPGAVWTWPTGINPAGAIIGFLYDANFVPHGFLRLP